jgi:pilus assembly protein CpaF
MHAVFTVVIHERGGAERRLHFDKGEVTVGRVQGNDVILPKGNVSKRHSRIVFKDDRFVVVDLKSTNGTYVNGRKLTSPLVVKPGDKIYIGDFILALEPVAASAEGGGDAPPSRGSAAGGGFGSGASAAGDHPAAGVRSETGDEAGVFGVPEHQAPPTQAPSPRMVAEAVQGGPGGIQLAPAAPADAPALPRPAPAPAPGGATTSLHGDPPPTAGPSLGADAVGALVTLMRRVSRNFDTKNASVGSLHDQGRWSQARSAIALVLSDMVAEGLIDDRMDQEVLTRAALREAVSLGALDDLLAHRGVREIVVEGPNQVVADFGRGLEPVATQFSSSEQLLVIARRLVASAGDELAGSKPIHETALPDGSRVIVVQPPVAVRGPVIEIRRAAAGSHLGELVAQNVLSQEMSDLLVQAIEARRNILVAGPVGSGVTTLLGALANAVPAGERVITVEDVPDLSLQRERVVALATGGADSGLTLRHLLAQAARLRSDRLVVDDVRGPEATDVLTTLATRREGCLVGLHAGGSVEPLAHLRVLTRIEHPLSDQAMDELIASAVHLVVQVAREGDNQRRVRSIVEVVSNGAAGGPLVTKPLFEAAADGGYTGSAAEASFLS